MRRGVNWAFAVYIPEPFLTFHLVAERYQGLNMYMSFKVLFLSRSLSLFTTVNKNACFIKDKNMWPGANYTKAKTFCIIHFEFFIFPCVFFFFPFSFFLPPPEAVTRFYRGKCALTSICTEIVIFYCIYLKQGAMRFKRKIIQPPDIPVECGMISFVFISCSSRSQGSFETIKHTFLNSPMTWSWQYFCARPTGPCMHEKTHFLYNQRVCFVANLM